MVHFEYRRISTTFFLWLLLKCRGIGARALHRRSWANRPKHFKRIVYTETLAPTYSLYMPEFAHLFVLGDRQLRIGENNNVY